MADGERLTVTIAVPTYLRPNDLRALLPMLRAQAEDVRTKHGARYDVDLLVVDNDPGGSGAEAVREQAEPRLRYVVEEHPGISAVRNRALDECAGSDLLAFIDDDERPAVGWLEHLLLTWQETRAAAVSGRVVAEYEGTLDPWIAAGEFFRRRSMRTGSEIHVAAAGNLLLDLRQVRSSEVRFANDLGLSGGEDTLFSRLLARAGGRMVWCDESVIADQVPAARMTRQWVLKRAWSHGNSAAVVEIRLARGHGRVVRVREFLRGAARILGGGARATLGWGLRSPRHNARGLRAVYRGAGMISAVRGVVYQEYARDGGEPRAATGRRPRGVARGTEN
ncbi:MAG: succinoglycan biosynthesis protein ExoM [Microbacteriaceae bacterium]|jgi:glycosyltransferase involved in cell wall biosynthesis|nr:succinoglycan biosynthesis protein ExoM [Microbacteriaceae bacterium]